MTDASEATMSSTELLALGRRHLAVRDFNAAAESLASACELLAKEHGDTADQCAEAYLWYGKALLGLSREESGVLGDGVPGTNNVDDDEDDNEEQEDNNEVENGENEEKDIEENEEKEERENDENKILEKREAESTTKEGEASSAVDSSSDDKPGTSNGEANESAVDMDTEEDVDNLQHAWEMLDLARSILRRRAEGAARGALLAEVHLALGEVALESETYDKAVLDMQSCLKIQKELYQSDDRRIAETHYQIGLANSLASNFEDAITHFKNAANILETRIKILEDPTSAKEDATVKKYSTTDPLYSVESEIKELKELLPEIQEKIQDMMDYKAETIKRVRESLCPSNGASSSHNGTSEGQSPRAASDISHLVKRKRRPSASEPEGSAPKRANT